MKTSIFDGNICLLCKAPGALRRNFAHKGATIITCGKCGAIEYQDVITHRVTQQSVRQLKNGKYYRTAGYKKVEERG